MAAGGLIVGLTGPTGAGKSTVCAIIARRGCGFVDADLAARHVVEKGKPCLSDLSEAFGKGILNGDGSLNRAKLAGIAFPDDAKREKLNKIMYPYIMDKIMSEVSELFEHGVPAVFIDAPTLFESGADGVCGKIVSVVAEKDARVSRVISRDGLSEAEARMRTLAQHDDDFYASRSDFVIVNDGEPEKLAKSVEDMFLALGISV